MRSALAIVPVCVLAMFLRGSEVQAQGHDHAAAPVIIEITMTEFSYSPAVLRIPAGQPVTLVFENEGAVQHEFMAGRVAASGDFEADLFANVDVEMESVGAADHDDAGAAPHDHPVPAAHMHAGQDDHGTMIVVEPGARGSMTFELPADLRGEWEMACFILGHYDGGMHGTVVVY